MYKGFTAKSTFLLLTFLFFSLYSAKKSFVVYGELAHFNKSYMEQGYKDPDRLSFPVLMFVSGGYYHHEFSNTFTVGGGLVQNRILKGEVNNFTKVEVQPQTTILLPYIYIGKQNEYFGIEVGLTTYISIRQYEDRIYLNQDGSSRIVSSSGSLMDRSDSHVFPNLNIRILKNDSFHIKIRFAREKFSAVDSLFNFAFFYPFGKSAIETYISLKTPKNFFVDESKMLKSNQRVGGVYEYDFGAFKAGSSFAILLSNTKGGGGIIDSVFNRLSLGVHFALDM